jgi:RNA 3'-terminal phosphate cyclase (ATP)
MPLEVEEQRVRARGPGASVTVWAEYERGFGSATALGARGVRIESVAQSAFEQFLQWFRSDATVDQHLADQLLVTAAIAETDVSFRTPVLTERLMTAVWVIKQFLPIYITVRGEVGQPGTVTVRH